MAQVSAYKVNTLVGVKPEAIVALKVPNKNAFELYVTNKQGVPFPLNVTSSSGAITSVKNTDNNLTISGTDTITINVSETLLITINSALQSGDNVSELVNDANYITLADVPTFIPSDYDLEDFTNASADPFAHVSEIENFVPYVGATQNVDLGDFQLKANGGEFDGNVIVPNAINDDEAINLSQLKIDTGVDSSITTVDFGGIPAGTNIQDRLVTSLLIDAMITYLYPQFTSQSCNYPSIVEVGTTISGSGVFTWAISNGANIVPNSVNVFDLNANNFIATGLANDGSQTVTLNSQLLNTNNATQVWNISAQNTKSEVVESGNIVTTAIHPIFYGVANSQPTANQALINSGTKSIVTSTGTLNITFGASGKYLWFAHPAINPTKTKWYVNALNNGNIGSISDLFNAPTTVSITTVMWAGVSYKIYISNIPTTTSGNMELKNS